MPTVAVIIVAAGSGSRLGAAVPKAFVHVGGKAMLAHALDAASGMKEPAQLIVVAPASQLSEAESLVAASVGVNAYGATVVVGAASRQGSVAVGLGALLPSVETVLVHDAARPFTPMAQFDSVAAAQRSDTGVVPALTVTDTIKQADGARCVERTLDRSSLYAVQTPQAFPRAQLVAAYASATQEFTDDAALFAGAGHPVIVVDGDERAFKITTPADLQRAEALLAAAPQFRTGVGIDVHAYDAAAPLWLGTLHWPDEPGLAGHSDGDALSHAICDALLSAAGLGDLGSRFGTSDPRFAGAHGDVFLTETVRLVNEAGFSIANVAVQLVAQHPKLGPRRVELEQALSGILGAPVSVSATTSDGLGFTGKGEGVAAMATALLHRDR